MPRPDQRRLPLLVVLVAVLGLLGVVVADGSASRGVHGAVDAPAVAARAVEGAEATAASPDPTVAPDARVDRGSSGGQDRSPAHRGERAVVLQLAADHLRPVAPTAPALTVLATVLVAALGGRSFVAAVVAVVARRSPHTHVRRRGPPALAVV